MTCSYANNVLQTQSEGHTIIEEDETWREFFVNANPSLFESGISEILLTPVEDVVYEGEKTKRYHNFRRTVPDRKYDLILIDAPNTDLRVDVLDLIPQNLGDSFCIILDDCDCKLGLATLAKLEQKLKASQIAYARGGYGGSKDVMVLASPNWKFLCSL
jgi:hypothetical protein